MYAKADIIKYFYFGFLADTDEWDHLCKNVSWAEIQSGGRVSETGVGPLPIRGCEVTGRHGSWGRVRGTGA